MIANIVILWDRIGPQQQLGLVSKQRQSQETSDLMKSLLLESVSVEVNV